MLTLMAETREGDGEDNRAIRRIIPLYNHYGLAQSRWVDSVSATKAELSFVAGQQSHNDAPTHYVGWYQVQWKDTTINRAAPSPLLWRAPHRVLRRENDLARL